MASLMVIRLTVPGKIIMNNLITLISDTSCDYEMNLEQKMGVLDIRRSKWTNS